MIIGYEDDPLVDAASMLVDALFWPTYLVSCLSDRLDPAIAEAAFDVDERDLEAYYKRLADPNRWPVFRVGLSDGHEIDIVYRNLPGTHGVDFVLCRPGGEHPLELANLEGHYFGPGLSWPELVATAAFSGAPHGVVEPDARLLLLLPAFGDADLPSGATARVTAALTSCGAGPAAGALAETLLAGWRLRWRQNDVGAVVCNGRHSRRNPDGRAAFSPTDLLEVTTALHAR
jgi:hypothetical protein